MRSIKVKSPCSSANLGSGFDSFGVALEAFHDIVTLELTNGEIRIEVTGLEAERIPKSPNRNTAGLVAKKLLEKRGIGVKIHLHKGIPLSMGLGSSGASAAACAYGLNELLKLGLSKNEIIKWAALGEIAAAGAVHADNVAASVLGGFTIVRVHDDLIEAVRIEPPQSLEVALAMPIIKTAENKTAAARAILPCTIPLKNTVSNIQNAAYIVAGFHFGDINMIGRGMTDAIAEPFRKKLIPCYEAVKKAALDAGAAGVTISGAGPTVIAVIDSAKTSARDVAKAMAEIFRDGGVECKTCCSKPSLKGTERIS
ncbi:homoserine kinase [Candidatus Bathyarchaeota archaeon]|nr:MAG: homoserine kinase [Candidatus Bathyarchaeota archaeon]